LFLAVFHKRGIGDKKKKLMNEANISGRYREIYLAPLFKKQGGQVKI